MNSVCRVGARVFFLVLGLVAVAGAVGADRPNILWLTVEDMSPHLGCYGDREARTPRLDAFAAEAVRYTRAFATAPVCSPARSCLITGMYATSLGTQRLRSQFPVPSGFGPFTAQLRAAGYYCSNNVKTDYNLRDEPEFIRKAWDECSTKAHWRGRSAGQPFFAVFNFMTTHQSRTSVFSRDEYEREVGAKLKPEDRRDPGELTLPPYHPETEEARGTWARYRECIALMDRQVGERLDELSADGLAENTIVFFYSDHGMGMPRGKRCLHDSGMRVPLLIRFPKRWAHLAPGVPGSTEERLVSFVDFAPTVLSLCGLEAPAHFQGWTFLGARADAPREFVHGARDRVDEAFDLARSVRDRRWLYIRNFMPQLSWMQPEAYSDGSTFRREFKRMAAEGRLGPGPMSYAAPGRALEELYDTEADLHQIRNLAAEPEHRGVLLRLRAELRRWQLETRDVGFLTEPQIWERLGAGETPWALARDTRRYPLERLLEVAGAVGREDAALEQRLWLRDEEDGVRYWAAVGLRARRELEQADGEVLRAALADEASVVRVEAAAALARAGECDAALPVLTAVLAGGSMEEKLHAARALELLGPVAAPAHGAMKQALEEVRAAEASGDGMAMFVRLSLGTAVGL